LLDHLRWLKPARSRQRVCRVVDDEPVQPFNPDRQGAHWGQRKLKEGPLKTVRPYFAFVAVLMISEPGFAQKLVNPDAVPPEYRAIAEKRHAEQLALFDCTKKASDAKVLPRDRPAFINHCIDENKPDSK
jgi:hypothetical protein